MKKLLVASHERSGTHFLINSIVNNSAAVYGQPDPREPVKDVYHGGPYNNPQEYIEYVHAFLNSYNGFFESKVFKTHHEAAFFKDYITEIQKEYHVFYIRRNPLDILTSLYHYYKNCEPGRRAHVNFSLNTDDFLFNKPPKDEWFSLTPSKSNVERLSKHIEGWENLGVNIVHYEDLKMDYQNTMDKIFDILEIRRPLRYMETRLSGVKPRKGVINDHVNLFTKDQISKLSNIFYV